MMHPNPVDNRIKLTVTGANTRFRCDDQNVLFVDSTPAQVRERYDESVGFVRQQMAAWWQNADDDSLTESEFGRMTQEIALHYMYFYTINSLPVEIDISDLNGPQTKRIIQTFAESKYGRKSDRAFELAACLAGVSLREFKQWSKDFERFLDR